MPAATSTMTSIVRTRHGVESLLIDRPPLPRRGEVLLRVLMVGLCRTDLHVAAGRIPCAMPRVLGHEIAASVAAVGADVDDLAVGDHVAVNPMIPCDHCRECTSGGSCRAPEMLGLDRDGGLSEEMILPRSALHRVPTRMSLERVAFVEPIAATLSVIGDWLERPGAGVVLGEGRIAELTRRILRAHGHETITAARDMASVAPLSWIVDTTGDAESIDAALHALEEGGTLILKARPAAKIPIDTALAVRRGLTLRAVGYAPFESAIDFLADADAPVDDLFAPARPLSEFTAVFADAERDTTRKFFLAPTSVHR